MKPFFSKEVEFSWHDTIKQIDQNDWILIFGNSRIKSYDLFRAMEEAKLPDAEFLFSCFPRWVTQNRF